MLKKCVVALFIFTLNILPAQEDSKLDQYITDQMNYLHIPGLAACIIKDKTIIWSGNYGFADIGKNKPVTDSTTFMLASLSKTFTATALMQLYEKNIFSLDDDINAYLPWSVRNPKLPDTPITFRMLLTHKSSILDNWNNMPVSTGDYTDLTLGEYLQEYLLPTGSYYNSIQYSSAFSWSYSNVGSALYGYLVENISKMSFDQYCKINIFEPLGLNRSSWFLEGMVIDNIAVPYTYSSSAYQPHDHYGFPWYPAAQLRTDKFELAKYLTAYIQNGETDDVRILDSTTVSLMTSSQYQITSTWHQGLAWFRKDFPSISGVWGHSGGLTGVCTDMWYSKEEKIGVIVLTNADGPVILDSIISKLFQYGKDYTGIDDNIAFTAKLNQNYPNPFNNTTNISYELFGTGKVTMTIYNTKGESVKTLFNGTQNAGKYSISFDASSLNSGVYYYKMEASGNTIINKMLLVK